MKKYIKLINGIQSIKSRKEIIVYRNGKQIINPTEEIILSDGYEEFVNVPVVLSDDELLKHEKESMIDKIIQYDSSSSINEFFIDDIELWVDSGEREILSRRFIVEYKKGITFTTLWKNGIAFSLIIEDAISMLDDLELYAIQCYDNTQKHIANVNAMNNINDVKNYDFKVGYPDKLYFKTSKF